MSNPGARLQPIRAIRLIFEYDGDRLTLVTEQPVDMVVTEASSSRGEAPGYYLDARDAGNRTLARVAAPDAFSAGFEVFPERHDEPIERIDAPRQRGAFTVTLPAVAGADHVTVVRVAVAEVASGAAEDRAQPRVVDLASFPLSRR